MAVAAVELLDCKHDHVRHHMSAMVIGEDSTNCRCELRVCPCPYLLKLMNIRNRSPCETVKGSEKILNPILLVPFSSFVLPSTASVPAWNSAEAVASITSMRTRCRVRM